MPNDRKHETTCAEVARLLKAERERQALTMSEVAERAGISQQMVSYVERGMRMPTLAMLLRISSVLNLPLWVILRQASEPAKPTKTKTGKGRTK